MKILSTEGLTKLIQLIKSNFISINDTVTTNTVELADVATSGVIGDLTDVEITNVQNQQILSYNSTTQKWENTTGGSVTVDQTFDGTSENAQSGVAIAGELENYQEKLTAGNNIKMEYKSVWSNDIYIPNFTLDSHPACIAYGNGKFVIMNHSGLISTSTDGITWGTAATASGLNWSSSCGNIVFIVYGNNKFVAITNSGYISTSTDGTIWTELTQNSDLSSYWWSCGTYDGSKFIILGNGDSTGIVSTSTDGATWTTVVENTALNKNWVSIVYDGRYVALDHDGYITWSDDGETWNDPEKDDVIGTSGCHWESMVKVDYSLVAMGNIDGSSGLYMTKDSTGDGTRWTTPEFQNTRGSISLESNLAYGNGKLIFVNESVNIQIYDYNKSSYTIDTIHSVDQLLFPNSQNAVSGQAIANTFVPRDAGNYHIANSTDGITLAYVNDDSNPTKQYAFGVIEQMGAMAAAMDMTDQTSPKMFTAGLTGDGIMLQNAVTSNTAILGVSSNNNLTVNGVEIGSTSIDNTTITKNTNDELQTVAVIDNNTSNAIKTWTGTKAQYDSIVTKDANTLYNITDDTPTVIYETLYSTTGTNTDGAMTQASTTSELNSINSNITSINSNLLNKADTNLSNLTTTSSTNFDGQWVSTDVTLTTATAVDTYTIDVSNMLPIDNYSYECLVSVEVATSDNTAINISSDVLTHAIAIGQNRGGASGVPTTYFRGNAILPVGTGRQIIVIIAGVAPIRNITYLLAYRRIGTNS